MKKISIIALICIFIDQIVKYLMQSMISLMSEVTVIPNFFLLTNVRNYGAAWSILDGNRSFFILMAFFCLAVLYVFFIRKQDLTKIETIGYGLLIGGIIGNLIDRMFLGYVVDYLSFYIFHYHYPVFNIADICIVVSVGFIFYSLWKEKDQNGTKNHSNKGHQSKN